ncbi:MAG: branched-chain amino acid ABC transporter permease [Nocardioides sp.]
MKQHRTLIVGAVPLVLGLVGWFAAANLTAYTLDVATSLLILLIAAQAFNILAGFTGQFSLGTSAFIGTGAYATALTLDHLDVGPWTALLAGAAAGGLLAVLLSPALLRLQGDYFTIGSLAAALGVQALATNLDLVGRSAGVDVPFASIPVNVDLFRVALIGAVTAAVISVWFARSPFGLRLSAVGQDQSAAVGLGIHVFSLRLVSFAVSGALTGVAGTVLALQQVHIEPSGSLGVSWTISVVLMTIVGGLGTLLGPVLGVCIIYLGVTKQFADQPITGLVVQGFILIAVVRFAPSGIWPLVRDAATRVRPSNSAKADNASEADVPAANTDAGTADNSHQSVV